MSETPMCISEQSTQYWLQRLKSWGDSWNQSEESIDLKGLLSCFAGGCFLDSVSSFTEYLVLTRKWITINGMEKAMKEIPTAGKLLAQVCRLPALLLHEPLVSELVPCMLALSELIKPVGCTETSKVRARAADWAKGHLKRLTWLPVDDTTAFLMEAFGISHEELWEELIQQILEPIAQSVNKMHASDTHVIMDLMTTMLSFGVKPSKLASLIEALLFRTLELKVHSEMPGNEGSAASLSRFLSIMELSEILQILSADVVSFVCQVEESLLEDQVLSVVEEFTSHRQCSTTKVVLNFLKESLLYRLSEKSWSVAAQAVSICKDCLCRVGAHPSILVMIRGLSEVIIQKVPDKDLLLYADDCRKLRYFLMQSPADMDVAEKQAILLRIDEELALLTGSELESRLAADAWFALVQFSGWVDEALFLLFDGSRSVIPSALRIIVCYRLFRHLPHLLDLTETLRAFVCSLRDLIDKKHMSTSQVEAICAEIKQKLPSDVNQWCIVLPLLMLFFVRSDATAGVFRDINKMILRDLGGDVDLMAIFADSLELTLQRRPPISPSMSGTGIAGSVVGIRQAALEAAADVNLNPCHFVSQPQTGQICGSLSSPAAHIFNHVVVLCDEYLDQCEGTNPTI